jgi:Flp pilus assembly pilin Flp
MVEIAMRLVRLIRGMRRPGGRPGGGRLARLHRDERGGMLDYVMIIAAIAIPVIALYGRMFQIISDYFGMIAFYVSWPFI